VHPMAWTISSYIQYQAFALRKSRLWLKRVRGGIIRRWAVTALSEVHHDECEYQEALSACLGGCCILKCCASHRRNQGSSPLPSILTMLASLI
jgi:hypothetical protein